VHVRTATYTRTHTQNHNHRTKSTHTVYSAHETGVSDGCAPGPNQRAAARYWVPRDSAGQPRLGGGARPLRGGQRRKDRERACILTGWCVIGKRGAERGRIQTLCARARQGRGPVVLVVGRPAAAAAAAPQPPFAAHGGCKLGEQRPPPPPAPPSHPHITNTHQKRKNAKRGRGCVAVVIVSVKMTNR